MNTGNSLIRTVNCLILGVLLLGLPSRASAQLSATPTRTAAEQEVVAFAASVDAALRAKDKPALERLIGAGFEFVHSTGRLEERGSYIQRAADGQLAVQRNPGEILSTHVSVFGSTAIRTTRTAVRMEPNDPTAPPTQVYTRDVYLKSDGAWRWISAQSTLVSPAVAATIR